MKNRFAQKLVATVLTVAMTFLLASPALAQETHILTGEALEVDLLTLEPKKPDTTAFESAALALETALDEGAQASRVAELMDALNTSYKQVETDNAVFYYYYCCDVARYAEDYLKWNESIQKVGNRFFKIIARLAASPYCSEAETVWGAEFVESYGTYQEPTEEMLALETRYGELVNEYWQFNSKVYTATCEGKEYTGFEEVIADYTQGNLTAEQGNQLFLDMEKQANADRGPIFIEVVKTLNELALLNGYDNYGEYAYENNYYRDFTMEDSAALHRLVQKYFVRIQQESSAINDAGPTLAASKAQCEEQLGRAGQAELVELVQPYMDDVSDQLATRFDDMLRGNLLDIENEDTKVDQAFTALLPSYQTSIIYGRAQGNVWGLDTLIHEFGHFSDFYGGTGLKQGVTSTDVMEIYSQGLELLYLSFADEMLGEGGSYYRASVVANILNSVISGCYQDEFLQAAFTTPDLTLDKLNRMYHDILVSYGCMTKDDTYEYTWTDVHHSIDRPFYYVGYAVSAMAALQLLEHSETDYAAACDEYLRAMEQSKVGPQFQELIAWAGLDNIFEEETVARTAAAVEDYFYKEAYGVDFPDMADTWAEDGARYCAAMGIVTGCSDGSFSNGAFTRAQAATMLWRLGGKVDTTEPPRFQDVPESAWYAKAVNRCVEEKVMTGTGEATFSPDAPISRQEFLLSLYRVYGSPETSAELSFSDQGEIRPDTLNSVRWAVENNLITGKPGARLAPNDSISKEEAAMILYRLPIA